MNKPFVSTYKQVVKNMTYVTKLIETVFNDEAASDGMSDAYYDEALNSFKVLGISVDTEHLNDEELHPSDYTHDVTWRLKSSYALGLGEYLLTGSKMILITMRADGSNPYQLAYSTTHGACYFRTANAAEDYWENWESAERNPIVRGSELHEKFVQLPGEYWVQPRDAHDVHDYQISAWEEYNNESFNLFGALTIYDDPTDWDARGQAVVKIKTNYHGTIDIMATAYTSEGQTVLSSEKVVVNDYSDPIILPFPKENLDTKIDYCKVLFFEHNGFVPALPAMTLESHPNGSAIWYKKANHQYIKVYPETIAEVIHDPGGEDVVVQIADIHNDITELQEDKIDKAGGTMEGTIDMNGNTITGLAAPVNDSDATTKEYVDEAIVSNGGIVIVDYDSDAAEAYEKIEEGYRLGKAIYVQYKDGASASSYVPYYLALVDGPSVGLLGNKYYKFRAIHGGYEYIATLTMTPRSCSWDFDTIEYLQTSGGAMSNDLNMDGHTISNLASPTNATDATTKGYVDGRYVTAGQKEGSILGGQATAEGQKTTASGFGSHAEGGGRIIEDHVDIYTVASGMFSHAEGTGTTASGDDSHAEGVGTISNAYGSHSEGHYTLADGNASHAEGAGTVAKGRSQHTFGEFNIEDAAGADQLVRGTYVEIVGNGSSSSARSNARTLDWSGNETLAGKLTLGAAPTNDMDAATKQYVDNSVQSIDGSDIIVTEEFTNPLNTDTMTLGDKTVYFTAYPSIKWQVMHVDGDYVYLALAAMTDTTVFGANGTYAGSTIAQKCTDYLNNVIPNVADFLEGVDVNDVMAKVFIPSEAMYDTEWDWPKASASNRICQLNGTDTAYWTSTAYDSSDVWSVNEWGNINIYPVSSTNGFRPAVKVRYHKVDPGSRDLNTALNDKQDRLTFDAAPTAGSTNPVISGGVKSYVDRSYTIAGQKAGTTLGQYATAEGGNNTASGKYSHAEGCETDVRGNYSHAEGYGNIVSGDCSHAEGSDNTASGGHSHAEGCRTIARGNYSHVDGYYTNARHRSQHVFGEFNVLDASPGTGNSRGAYVEIVGNGTDNSARSNARTLDWSGNETLAGKLTLGAAPTNDMDATTKKYVDDDLSGKLNTSGGTMTGAINMGSKKITSLATPTDDTDAATKKYVDDTIGNMITEIFVTGTTAPTDTRLLWIDTTADTGGLKFYNGTSWVHVPVGYTPISSLSGLTGPTATPTPLNMIFTYGATAPSDTRLLWIDTSGSTGGLKFHDGSSWVHVPVSYD